MPVWQLLMSREPVPMRMAMPCMFVTLAVASELLQSGRQAGREGWLARLALAWEAQVHAASGMRDAGGANGARGGLASLEIGNE